MDPSNNEHSDSDSGESWTILDNSPTSNVVEDNTPDSTNTNTCNQVENLEKDEDTDGISIISDSEPELPTYLLESCHSTTEDIGNEKTQLLNEINTQPTFNDAKDIDIEPSLDSDIIGDNNKHRIYVHRRNNRISTVLNIVMLVSVMTAAGVAIGHMWGARNECPSQITPSFNKILSDLYKLREENDNYRNKFIDLLYITESNLQEQCEKESHGAFKDNHDSFKCLQEKVDRLHKYLSHINHRKNKRKLLNIPEKEVNYMPGDEFYLTLKNEMDERRKFIKNNKFTNFKATRDSEKYNTEIPIDNNKSIDKIDDNILAQNEFDNKIPQQEINYADSHNVNSNLNMPEHNLKDAANADKLNYHENVRQEDIDLNMVNYNDNDLKENNKQTISKQKQQIRKHDSKTYKKVKRMNKQNESERVDSQKDFNQNKYTKNSTRNNKNETNNKTHENFNKKRFNKNFTDFNESIKSEQDNADNMDKNWYINRAQFRNEARNTDIENVESQKDFLESKSKNPKKNKKTETTKSPENLNKKRYHENRKDLNESIESADKNKNWYINRAEFRDEARKTKGPENVDSHKEYSEHTKSRKNSNKDKKYKNNKGKENFNKKRNNENQKNINDSIESKEDINPNWYVNRAEFRNEARKRQEWDISREFPKTGDWFSKRMHKREQHRLKENTNNQFKKREKFKLRE